MSWIDDSQAPAGDRMAPIASRINADYAEFCDLLVEADRAQEWLAEGSPNLVQWMSARFGIDEAFGRRLSRLAKRLQDLPELRKRFAAGDLSLDAVDLLSEVATPDTEIGLIDEVTGRDLHDLARMASREKPPTNTDSAEARAAHWFSTQWDLRRKKMRLAGELTGVEAQVVEDRLVGVAKTTPKNPETGRYDDWEKRMADSLFEVCATRDGRAPVPTTVVHADLDALANPSGPSVSELGSGPVISNQVARSIGCDSALEMVLERDGRPVGIGRRSRSIPGWLRRQVEYRDHHCRFPGCGRTVFLQIHHLEHWADGGRTDFDSLVLLCWWHHIFIHEKGWHVSGGVVGQFVFRKPDWSIYPPLRPT